MIGNEEDFTASLGFEVKGADDIGRRWTWRRFKGMIETAVKTYPNFKVAATTLRAAKTATRNDWGAICGRTASSMKPADPPDWKS